MTLEAKQTKWAPLIEKNRQVYALQKALEAANNHRDLVWNTYRSEGEIREAGKLANEARLTWEKAATERDELKSKLTRE